MRTIKARPVLAIIIAVLALIVLSGVAYAFGRSLGYIPGIGMVDTSSPLRKLAKPVSLTRDGITVTVEEAILSSDKTIIRISVDPIPHDILTQFVAGCNEPAMMKLPDGSTLDEQIGTGYRPFIFSSLPANVNEATLILPCIRNVFSGTLPENWELHMQFVPVPAGTTVMPVEEVTPQQESLDKNPMVLEKVIETETGYILIGKFHSVDLPNGANAVQFSSWPKITDANGQSILFTLENQEFDLPAEKTVPGTFAWAFHIEGKSFHWPLTISPVSVAVVYGSAQAQFEFDAGPSPQNGQVWELNLDLGEMAGYPVKVTRVIGRPDGYEFYFESPQIFHGINVTIGDSVQGPTGMDGVGLFSSNITFANGIRSGRLEVLVTHPIVALSGNWQLQWQPKNASALPTPTPSPEICFTTDTWRAAMSSNTAVPTNISGRLFFQPGVEGAFVANPDGSNRQALGLDRYFSVSHDGSMLAYSEHDGLYVKYLITGESHHILNTVASDSFPAWSPDGTRLAFERDVDSTLYIINLDGSGLQRVDREPEYEQLRGWSPDGISLFYSVHTGDGNVLRRLDIASGSTHDLFDIGVASRFVSVSRDGSQVVYFKAITDTINGMYISNIDGSNRQLVARWNVMTEGDIYDPIFSPDGNWLAVTIIDRDSTDGISVKTRVALINPGTCQIIPLPFTEWLSSWVP